MRQFSVFSFQCSVFLLAALLAVPASVPADETKKAADDVQDFVFLAEARPILVRLHVRVDGKPLPSVHVDTKERADLYDRILEGVRTLSGVESAAWTSTLPLTGETWVDLIARVGDTRPTMQKASANYRFIGWSGRTDPKRTYSV